MAGMMAEAGSAERIGRPLTTRPVSMALAYSVVTVGLILLMALPAAEDYVGRDNDDVMRLVQVRDLLAGQGWFDLMQYRLGLAGGTPMHWSRLVDLPITLLIRLFSLFLPALKAEAAALAIWPLLLVPLLLIPLGIAARRIGGSQMMHIALGLGSIFLLTCIRFAPGAIDHHNVQLVLAMWIAAMLADPERRISSYAIAGTAAALAIAIGAETMPFVAVACLCVVLQWAWHGPAFAASARAFGLGLALAVSACFFLTVPPARYTAVTCDSLSFGFYALSALGGVSLALLACLPARLPRTARFGLIGSVGIMLLGIARLVAPECLGDPLGSLDPMLVELWLNSVTEAQSLLSEMRSDAAVVGGFYAVGLFAMAACLFRAAQGERVEFHLVFFALLLVSWGVAAIQVRGALFANLMSILPLSLLIADLRRQTQADPENMSLALPYVLTVLASVPVVWGLAGALAVKGLDSIEIKTLSSQGTNTDEVGDCRSAADMEALAELPPGVVAAPSNSGASILRYTSHRVLAAPYHRNQGGMLAELHIGLATPQKAEALLHEAGVTLVAFCAADPQTQNLMKLKPGGLYAALARGEVPAYLQPIGGEGQGEFRLFRVLPAQ